MHIALLYPPLWEILPPGHPPGPAGQAPPRHLDMLEKIVRGHGQKALAFKDETFTADRQHALELCRGITRRGLNFLWSCDTRADTLDEELLAAMRRAGCQRISLGVESASAGILKNLNKKISPDLVREATAMAKQFGFQVRFYMIAGSRGETLQTLRESIDFVRAVKPTEVVFSPFTLFPGTREFELALQRGQLSADLFFSEDFLELNPLLYDTENPDARAISGWLVQNAGVRSHWDYSVPEREAILARLPEVPAARLDLAGALLQQGDIESAERAARDALEQGYPLEGIIDNYFACIAARQGRLEAALEHLIKAREHGFCRVVENNIESAQRWAESGGPRRGLPLDLSCGHKFEITRPKAQPTTPGKITLTDAGGQETVFRPVSL